MNGEEVRERIKGNGITLASVANELGISPQNLNSKLKAKSVKHDFLTKILNIIDRCCPPLPAEMEAAVMGSAPDGSDNADTLAALRKENEMLRQFLAEKEKEIEFLRILLQQQGKIMEKLHENARK